jgi:hypothetical protein
LGYFSFIPLKKPVLKIKSPRNAVCMIKICVVTGTRAEYGLLYWTMKEIQDNSRQFRRIRNRSIIEIENQVFRFMGFKNASVKRLSHGCNVT